MLSAADTTGSSIAETLVDCRTTTVRGGTMIGSGCVVSPAMIRSSSPAPRYPTSSWFGSMLVSDGAQIAQTTSLLSTPMTATSSGTATPASRHACVTGGPI